MRLSNFVAIGLIGFAFLATVETSFGAKMKPVQGMAGKLGKSCTATSPNGSTVKKEGKTVEDSGGNLWCEGKDDKGNVVSVECGGDNKCTTSKTVTSPASKSPAIKDNSLKSIDGLQSNQNKLERKAGKGQQEFLQSNQQKIQGGTSGTIKVGAQPPGKTQAPPPNPPPPKLPPPPPPIPIR